MENSIIGLTPPLPPLFWPKLWKILKNINYFLASKSGLETIYVCCDIHEIINMSIKSKEMTSGISGTSGILTGTNNEDLLARSFGFIKTFFRQYKTFLMINRYNFFVCFVKCSPLTHFFS